MNKGLLKIRLTTFQTISLGFLALILLGAFLLMLPFAKAGPGGAGFLEALFTSTSAVCVTGLVVQDTATYWSPFGHGVILALIQIGGMGVVMSAVGFAMISGKKIGLMQRSTLKEAISAHHIGGVVKLMSFILKTTVFIELTGAVILGIVFAGDFGFGRGMWYGLFHSVSAFCNAGFDLMGVNEKFSSLTAYADNGLVNAVIMLLIIIGGIGFLTWEDIKTNKWHFHEYRMQTKVILTTTLALILIPAAVYFFLEFSSEEWTHLTMGERILYSLFQAVTPRTAGFNTAELTRMSEAGILFMLPLMLIGGSPGSTAGGMKTTTAAVLLLSALSVFRRRDTVHCFGRRIDDDEVRSAASILILYLLLFTLGAFMISYLDKLPVLTALFEAASAIGTVGLTLGVTPTLSLTSRLILILLMFFGRVGGLTLIFSAASGKKPYPVMLPKEKITVG